MQTKLLLGANGMRIHMIVEAPGKDRLSLFMKSMTQRIVNLIHQRFDRTGPVFADRDHRMDLKSVRRVSNAICYVLCNANKHGVRSSGPVDFLSSAPWFAGWRGDDAPPESRLRGGQATNWKILNCVRI